MVTLSEIAEIAGVSSATVSNVLNGKGRVSNEVRERILKIAAEHQYVPNLVAKNLRMKSSRTIGVIVEDITSFNSPAIIDGINDFAEKNEYFVLLSNLRMSRRIDYNTVQVDEYREIVRQSAEVLLQKQVEGIIYVPISIRNLTGLLNLGDRPAVYAYATISDSKCGKKEFCIGVDEERAAYSAARELVEAGHEKIGCVMGVVNNISTQKRLAGFQRCLYEAEIAVNPQFIVNGKWNYRDAYESAKCLLSKEERPTAIFSMSDVMAYGVMRAARELGIRIPEQLSMIGIDNIEYDEYEEPPLSTFGLPLWKIGFQAAELLISGGYEGMESHYKAVPCEKIMRESLARIPR